MSELDTKIDEGFDATSKMHDKSQHAWVNETTTFSTEPEAIETVYRGDEPLGALFSDGSVRPIEIPTGGEVDELDADGLRKRANRTSQEASDDYEAGRGALLRLLHKKLGLGPIPNNKNHVAVLAEIEALKEKAAQADQLANDPTVHQWCGMHAQQDLGNRIGAALGLVGPRSFGGDAVEPYIGDAILHEIEELKKRKVDACNIITQHLGLDTDRFLPVAEKGERHE